QGCHGGPTSRVCKVLLKFPQLMGPNTGQIPIGATIVSATLQLYIPSNNGTTEDLYQTWESWTEATVTWNSFATHGFPQRSGVVLTFVPAPPGWVSVNVTYVVQKWAEGDPNQGVLLSSLNGDAVEYASSEFSTLANRPKLTVTYEAPVAPELRDPRAWLRRSGSEFDLYSESRRSHPRCGWQDVDPRATIHPLHGGRTRHDVVVPEGRAARRHRLLRWPRRLQALLDRRHDPTRGTRARRHDPARDEGGPGRPCEPVLRHVHGRVPLARDGRRLLRTHLLRRDESGLAD